MSQCDVLWTRILCRGNKVSHRVAGRKASLNGNHRPDCPLPFGSKKIFCASPDFTKIWVSSAHARQAGMRFVLPSSSTMLRLTVFLQQLSKLEDDVRATASSVPWSSAAAVAKGTEGGWRAWRGVAHSLSREVLIWRKWPRARPARTNTSIRPLTFYTRHAIRSIRRTRRRH